MTSRTRTALTSTFALLTALALTGLPSPAAAITVTFDAGSGIQFSYSEAGMSVDPEVSGFYLNLGDNDGNTSPDLMNHPACCSTPYRFTYNGGAVFSVAQFDFVLNAGTHNFISSLGSTVTPASSGVVSVPASGWTGITFFRWHAPGSDPSQTGIMDNLKFCPGDCSDGNVCTDDSCDPDDAGADANGCIHTANSASCDDGLFCNGADTCSGGSCSSHAGDPCAGGLECANVCDEGGNTCLSPNTAPCTDDGNTCTDDHCNGAGSCVHITKSDGSSCDDSNTCTDNDTCTGGVCNGTPGSTNCDDGNPCTQDVCLPQGGCDHPTAPRDGFVCDDTNPCTQQDTCQDGVCHGALFQADTDGDGYCDIVENQAGCSPTDAGEIPIQASTFAGSPGKGNGEVLASYAAPGLAKVPMLTDPSCATSGTCGPIGFCTVGKIASPCQVNADCDLPAGTCRVVVNYANIPDLALVYARLNTSKTNYPGFTPATKGCSRKIDLTLDPSRRKNTLKIKVQGTVAGFLRRDRDRFRYQ